MDFSALEIQQISTEHAIQVFHMKYRTFQKGMRFPKFQRVLLTFTAKNINRRHKWHVTSFIALREPTNACGADEPFMQ